MKSKSLFFKLPFIIFVLLLITISSIITFFYFFNDYNFINYIKKKQINNSLAVLENIKNEFIKSDYKSLNDKLNKTYDKFTLILANGNIIYDSIDDQDNILNNEDIITALKSKTGFLIRDNVYKDKRIIYISLPVIYSGKLFGILRSAEIINKNFPSINELFLLIIILLIFSIILSFIISKIILYPINRMRDSIKNIIDGNYKSRIYFTDYKEVEALSSSFNEMIFNLKKNMDNIQNERDEFKSIFESINESVIVVDNDDKIVRVNESFNELVGIKSAINKYYWEIIKESELIHYIKDENKDKQHILREIFFKNKYLLCSINYLKEKKYHVVIFYDITKIKNLENIKKDFISNVSHELHTPLTAIKGFAETLIDEESNKDKKKYLEIINRHTERLINIVKDLLTISKLEKSNLDEVNEKINIEKIEIENLIKTLMEIFGSKLEEKKIKISCKNIDNIKTIEGDYFKLEQLFINLIDNAVKYTDNGEIKIVISNDDIKDNIKFEVIDTGIGIPENDLSRIFERFYVVDKSRSKLSGGTGLGLSIVKYIVLLHNGIIKVKSKLNEGSVFTVILPKKQIINSKKNK